LGRTNNRSELGISAIEVVAVAALAFTLALLVWPKMVRSTRAANEASAVITLKEIGQAEMIYAATYPAIGFAENLNQLGGLNEPCSTTPARACLLAEVARPPFAYRGYSFSATGYGTGPRTAFLSLSVPLRPGDTGQLSFCSTNRWLIHYRANGQSIFDAETCDGLPLVR
jgi:type IV pilus assembly protein PilA